MYNSATRNQYLFGFDQLKSFVYGERQMWPHPSPLSAFMPPTVTIVPHEEYKDFMRTIVARYKRTLLTGWLPEAWYAWRNPGLEAVSDAEFIRLLTETPFCKSLNPQLDPTDYETFREILATAGPTTSFYKYDFSAMDDLEPLDGLFSGGTVTLLRRTEAGFEALAIRLNDIVFTPHNGAAWELAKYYVLMGAGFHLLYAEHPLIHFPVDVLNALTKTLLPKQHVLFKLLHPHCYLQLPLNYGVLYNRRSVAHNNQKELFTPFHLKKTAQLFEFMGRRYSGEQNGNSSYSKYRFMMGPRPEHTTYDKFINNYYAVILRFCTEVLRKVQPQDPYVKRWASTIADYLPGFPDGNDIFESDTLARAAAGFITNSSVIHSLDHYLYSLESVRKVPFRLRQAPPASREITALDRQNLVQRDDIFRHRMARKMFFQPYTVKRLMDVNYNFGEERLELLSSSFKTELQATEPKTACANLIPLAEIASSIQY